QGDEGEICDQQVRGPAEQLGGQHAHADPVVDGDARVLAHMGGELVVSDVDSTDVGRAAAQQHIAEPAGGRTGVHTAQAAGVDAECVQSADQLVRSEERRVGTESSYVG